MTTTKPISKPDEHVAVPGSEDDYAIHTYASVPDEDTHYLLNGMVPFGMLTGVDGYPGSGKSTLAIDLMARATRGEEMPDGTRLSGPIHCIYQCTEAGKRSVIKSLLKTAGADLDKVTYIEGKHLTVADSRLRRAIEEQGARLLVIDPVQEYFDADMNSAQVVRRELGTLGQVAARYDCAVLLIGHFTKDAPSKALYHGMGSSDIYAIARSVLHVIDMGEESTLRYVKCVKANNSPTGAMLWYEIVDAGVVKWIGPEDPENAEHLEEEVRKRPSPQFDAALQALCELLPIGVPVPSATVQRSMAELHVADSTYRRARRSLSLSTNRLSDGWYVVRTQ